MWESSKGLKLSVVAALLGCVMIALLFFQAETTDRKEIIVPDVLSQDAECESWTMQGASIENGQTLKAGQRFRMSAAIVFTSDRVRAASPKHARNELGSFVWQPWIRFVKKPPGADVAVYEKTGIFVRASWTSSKIATGELATHAPKRPGVYEVQLVIGKEVRGDFPLDLRRDGEIVARRKILVEKAKPTEAHNVASTR
jgi:hypothetical protein